MTKVDKAKMSASAFTVGWAARGLMEYFELSFLVTTVTILLFVAVLVIVVEPYKKEDQQ